MPLIFFCNLRGILTVVAAICIGIAMEASIGPRGIAPAYIGTAAAIVDLIMRYRSQEKFWLDRWLGSAGGGIFLLPLWIPGLVLSALPLVKLITEALGWHHLM